MADTPPVLTNAADDPAAASKVSKSRGGRSATSMQYAQHGRDLVGCKSPVLSSGNFSLGVSIPNEFPMKTSVRGEGNCGRVTDRGKEACEDVRKRRVCSTATRTLHTKTCQVTNRNPI